METTPADLEAANGQHDLDGLAALQAEELFQSGAGEGGKWGQFKAGEVFENRVNAQQPGGFIGHSAKPTLLHCSAQLCGMEVFLHSDKGMVSIAIDCASQNVYIERIYPANLNVGHRTSLR